MDGTYGTVRTLVSSPVAIVPGTGNVADVDEGLNDCWNAWQQEDR